MCVYSSFIKRTRLSTRTVQTLCALVSTGRWGEKGKSSEARYKAVFLVFLCFHSLTIFPFTIEMQANSFSLVESLNFRLTFVAFTTTINCNRTWLKVVFDFWLIQMIFSLIVYQHWTWPYEIIRKHHSSSIIAYRRLALRQWRRLSSQCQSDMDSPSTFTIS